MHITILSTYPGVVPRHGGQHRVANITAMLQRSGHEVHSIGVLGSELYQPCDGFLPFPGYDALRLYLNNPFLMEDWSIGRWVVENASAYRSLSKLIDKRTQVIFCEQPWLFAFAKKYRNQTRRSKILLIYGSQNVESELKREIIDTYYGASYAEECAELIHKVEVEAVSEADLICTVSEADARWASKYARAQIVLAPNGVSPARASIQDVIEANEITDHCKFALYVASAHPPNVLGFYDIFGAGVGCFGPKDRMVVAGSAGQSIRNDERFAGVAGLGKCFVDGGIVSDSQLRGLLKTAHCIFLPMTSGGGTNLKTAEALWSGRAVIATPLALRGFEGFQGAPGVHMCEDKRKFLATIQSCMAESRFEIDSEERASRKSLLWGETLRPLVNALEDRNPYA